MVGYDKCPHCHNLQVCTTSLLKTNFILRPLRTSEFYQFFRETSPSGISMFEYQKVALHELYSTALVTRSQISLRSHAHLNFLHRKLRKEASGDSARQICKVKASVDSFFIELSTAFCMRVLLARAEIFTIYWRPLEVSNSYLYKPMPEKAKLTEHFMSLNRSFPFWT